MSPFRANQLPGFEPHSVGVDWATLTTRVGARAVNNYYRAMGIIEDAEKAGNERRSWRSSGYVGWSVPGISVGRRVDGCIVRLSGEYAQHYWRGFHAASDNVSRLDLAVTACCADPGFPVAWAARSDFLRWRKDHDRRIKYTYVDAGSDGSTFNLGSRQSERYGRIYDKYAESGGDYPAGSWRYEVELKGATALAVASDLFGEPKRSTAIVGLVMGYFRDKGVQVPFGADSHQWSYTIHREPLQIEKKLAWLRDYVAHTVGECAAFVGEREVLQALGLAPNLLETLAEADGEKGA